MSAVLLLSLTLGAKSDDLESRARTFVTDFMAGRYERVKTRFDSAMRAEWTESKFFGVSYTIKSQFGDLESILSTHEEKAPKYRIIVVTCRFSRSRDYIHLEVRVVFDSKGRVAGLFFPSSKTQSASAYAPYLSRDQ